jgi:hypothetical protein
VSESIDRSISADQHVDVVSDSVSPFAPPTGEPAGIDAAFSYKTLRAPASKLSMRAAGAGCDAPPLPAVPPPAALLAAGPESGSACAGGRLIGAMPA